MDRATAETTYTGSNHRQVRDALGGHADLNCRGPYLPVGDLGHCQVRADDGRWVDVHPGQRIHVTPTGRLAVTGGHDTTGATS